MIGVILVYSVLTVFPMPHRREVINHSKIHCHQVIEFKEVFLTKEYLCLVLELAPGKCRILAALHPGLLPSQFAQHVAWSHSQCQAQACSANAGGDLLSYINDHQTGLQESEARWIFQQVMSTG